MVRLLRHRQTKEPVSARPYLNRRATPRLHLIGSTSANVVSPNIRCRHFGIHRDSGESEDICSISPRICSEVLLTFCLSGNVEEAMSNFTRREFLKTGLAAGTLAVTGTLPLIAQRQTATDFVTLGRSGVKVTRLAFGTGSFSGQVQRDLGQDGFTRLVRYGYDRGIRFFETAESYTEMHKMLGIALNGIPRESYQLMSKVTTRDGENPQQKVDGVHKGANTKFFDIRLPHWQHVGNGPPDPRHWQD